MASFIRTITTAALRVILPAHPLDTHVNTLSYDTLAALLRPKEIQTDAGGRAYTLFGYRDDNVRKVIHALKYRGNKEAAELLAQAFLDTLPEYIEERIALDLSKDIRAVPVPLSPGKQRVRGFNQTGRIAELFCEQSGCPLEKDAIVKIRETKNQTGLKREERLVNLRGAFAVPDAGRVKGKTIILLDDIVTTGSTLGEAERALSNAGAKQVIPIALARSDDA